MKRLREQWPWNDGFLKAFFWIPTLTGIILFAFLLPRLGYHALWLLFSVFAGIILHQVYGYVGKRVGRLRREYMGDPGEIAEGMMIIGRMQSPGLIILRERELLLIPIVGAMVAISVETLKILKVGRMLPGKYVWGKRAFILHSETYKRLAFAVEESIGDRWLSKLNGS